MENNKNMVQSVEVEQALLGTLLMYSNEFDEVRLSPYHFSSPPNALIYEQMQYLYKKNGCFDIAGLIARLKDIGQFRKDTADYLMNLSDLGISAYKIQYYESIILDKYLRRKQIETAEQIAKLAYESESSDDAINEAALIIDKLQKEQSSEDMISAETVMSKTMDNLFKNIRNKGIGGISSGFSNLDKLTNGFQPTELIVVAARPAVGKTAFAINLAINAAVNNGKSVALFELEMGTTQIGNRMLSLRAGVDQSKLKSGKGISNDEFAKIDEAMNSISSSKIYLEEQTDVKVNDILGKCRKIKKEHGLDLIIIDYLQLMRSSNSNKNYNREQEVAEISRSLKLLAKKLEVPVIALSQMSRKVEDSNREPVLADLRESGAIEQDADIVMFLHKDRKKAEEEEKDNQDIKLIIAKNRNGETGSVDFKFEGRYNKFYQVLKR